MNNRILDFFSVNNKGIGFFIINLITLFYITRTAIPFFKYPFLILYVSYSIYILLNHRDKLFSIFKNIINNFFVILVLFLYLCLSLLFSDKIYLMIVKDIINIMVLLSLMIMFKILIRDKNDLKYFYKSFLYLAILFAFVISIQKIYYYFYISSYYNSSIYKNENLIDHNFALLPVFFGMTGILYIISKKISKFQIIIYNILLFIFSINFLLSGSKRGILIFLLLFILIFSTQLLSLFVNNLKIKQLGKNTSYYLFSFSFFIIFIIYIFFNTSVYYKNNILERIGVKSIAFTKRQISETIYRYVHYIDKDISDYVIYQKIWQPVFDPKDPDARWCNRMYKTVPVLSGKNVEIVPVGTKGYLLDNTTWDTGDSTHAYYSSCIKQDKVKDGDSILTSVYCYVSENFDGHAAAIRAEGSLIGNPDIFYNLNNKGCWQKLVLPLNCKQGAIFIYLYFNKQGVTNFSTLKGYIIFAYPEYKKISKDSIINNPSQKINRLSKNIIEKRETNYSKLNINHELLFSKNLNKGSFFIMPFNNLISLITMPNDSDPVRNWIAKIVSEDTTYNGYKANLYVEKSGDTFGEDRIARWMFAIDIFNKEYSWPQKIFGGGFNFLNWYGYYFYNDKTRSDYPHNPFLSVLLYSGIIGLILYLILIYKVFYYYIKYFNEYKILFIFFIITFFFSFFSAGSPFDPPIMGFFVILPFFIHSIHKKSNPELN